MAGRRRFLAGLMATGLCPQLTWADAGSPRYLAAARKPSGQYALFGLDASGVRVFELALPDRGHAAAAHPARPVAVAFARRPGTFAVVIDCALGREIARLTAPEGHHFSGHGSFSAAGDLLFTAENDYEAGRGMVGVWDARRGYARLASFPSGGTGPHDLLCLPDGRTLLVANGGIETHPETGRAKLNLPSMRPNLSYLTLEGALLEQVGPPAAWHKNSLRHLAVRGDGLVAVAAQWQGDLAQTPPLLATHRRGAALQFHKAGETHERDMQGYAGSIAFSGSGDAIAITGPRGGVGLIFSASGRLETTVQEPDICGVAAAADGFAFTSGLGLFRAGRPAQPEIVRHRVAWDNHLIQI
ncbi:DUF1513 domain-containing protein [Roseobacter weihaiensis]|uniref:DUF1513 domain-containing protein n=1 Tax=Roseobacter weihaiensis TaxID=2763262 RepID=UPI001D0B59C0|nr:DUF1513 domain-containing protein [Roseobacter sp. H9]